jgi:Protein of unknown function (DUF3574)
MRIFPACAAAMLFLASGQVAAARETACPFANQKPMLIVQLFFGRNVTDRGPISAKEWRAFLARTVTPRFPQGFTVVDAYGQEMNPRTRSISRERTKIIVIATEDSAAVRARIAALSRIYLARFHQRSAGIVTNQSCGAF